MECEFPTINATNKDIKTIFANTKTIAIVGLSPDPTKDSNRVGAYLQSVGFRIIPIYPKEEIILGEKVYRSLTEVPCGVDMVNIFRKPDVVMQIVEDAIKRGDVKTIWMQKGIVNNEAAAKAISANMHVVQNHCTMVEYRQLMA